ncbi:MAG TPA: thioredoxin domain-containing protein [Candidatus Saccharimonadales bacterium]
MTRNTWIIFTAVVVAVFGGLIYFSTRNSIDVSKVNENSVLAADAQSGNIADHVFGNPKSKVVLVEYGDYQCPGCGSAYQPLKTASEKYKGEMAFVFRNFPLTNMHPNARAAAAVAESAGILGKFWEMHDKLYETQDEWSGATSEQRTKFFTSYAVSIGLDEAKFTATLKEQSETINQKISFDTALGRKIGVDGTPGIYLNGKKVEGDVKDGKLIPSDSDSSTPPVWSNIETLEQFFLQPAFKENGVKIEEPKTKKS